MGHMCHWAVVCLRYSESLGPIFSFPSLCRSSACDDLTEQVSVTGSSRTSVSPLVLLSPCSRPHCVWRPSMPAWCPTPSVATSAWSAARAFLATSPRWPTTSRPRSKRPGRVHTRHSVSSFLGSSCYVALAFGNRCTCVNRFCIFFFSQWNSVKQPFYLQNQR